MSNLIFKTYMMDPESDAFLTDFKKKHRFSKSLVVRTIAKYYINKEGELLKIMECEVNDG